jgi:hypothetical protein
MKNAAHLRIVHRHFMGKLSVLVPMVQNIYAWQKLIRPTVREIANLRIISRFSLRIMLLSRI